MSIQGSSKYDNILLNSQNRETWKNRFSWGKILMMQKIWKKHFVKENFRKWSKVGRGANLTRCINRAVDLLKRPNNFSDVASILEELEFAARIRACHRLILQIRFK